jgi:hypothetical protein
VDVAVTVTIYDGGARIELVTPAEHNVIRRRTTTFAVQLTPSAVR